MEWTNELIFEFLNLYQNEPTLWNSTAPEHKNKTDAYDAWNRIKTQLKDGTISVKDLKRKRDNLMATYRRQRTKVRESMGTGSGADDVYKPEWPFYDIMATFLDVIYKAKKTKSSEDPLYSEEIEEEHDNDTTEQPATTAQPTTFKTPKTLEKNKSKRSRSNESDELKKRSEEAYNIMKQMSKTESDTSLLYCNLLCNKLRGLQESTRDIAMMEIDKIIYTLKQQDNQARNFPNSVYQNMTLPISQQLYNSQPSPQYQVSLQSPGYSHSFNSQPSPGNPHSSNSLPTPQYQVSLPSPGYSHLSNSQPSPGNSHSSNSLPSPQYQVSLPSTGYSHLSNSQPSPGNPHSSNSLPSPQYQVSLPSPGYSHLSNSQPSPGNPHSSNSLSSPGYSHSTNSQSSPQHQVSLLTPGEVHSSSPQPSPGNPPSSNSQCQFSVPPPGNVHSSNPQPPPQHQHSLPQGLQLKQYYENTIFH